MKRLHNTLTIWFLAVALSWTGLAKADTIQVQDNATALELYRSVLDTYGDNSAYAPKAMFSIGRIYDAQGETALAQAEFETLTGLYLVPENGGTPSEYARMAEAYLINYAD